jgi:hypothetical protein
MRNIDILLSSFKESRPWLAGEHCFLLRGKDSTERCSAHKQICAEWIEITRQEATASMQYRRDIRRAVAQGETMLILLILLLVLTFGAFPTWPYSRNWGYYPSGGLGLVLLIVLIVVLVNGGL